MSENQPFLPSDTQTVNKTSFRKTLQEVLRIMQRSDPYKAIDKGFAKLLTFFEADRIYIGYFNETDSSISFIHDISNDGSEGISSFLSNQLSDANLIYEKDFPWWISKIKRGEDTIIDDVMQMPPEASFAQELMIKNGVKSILCTSIHCEHTICGFLGIEHTRKRHTWLEAEIDNLHLFSDLFSLMIQNEQKEEMKTNFTKLSMVINTCNSYIWEYDFPNDEVTIDYSLLDYEHSVVLRSSESQRNHNKRRRLEQIHKEDWKKIQKQIARLLRNEIDSFTETYRQYLNQELRWVTTYFHTYAYDAENTPCKMICLTTDITQQRENELELIKIREANKIKTAFIANMSHELRTPLNAIVGFSSILAENNKTEENQYFIDLILKNNYILLNIIDNILHFTKAESCDLQYNKKIVDLKKVCQEAVSINYNNRNPHVELVFDQHLPSCPVWIDYERTVQVIFHLLDNANKYTNQGTISLSYQRHNDCEVRVEVRDTGIGLSQEESEKVFQQYYKVDNFKTGLGLGLPIAKKIIEDLGGRIGVDSAKGVGSTFWFTLPLAQCSD
ncbi:signal transduction histidine kinase [Parabacteroides sp. PFB2-12]|nr:signal transduction histidine kinase [Parabacteroides sp. PM6-13]MDH6390541.1 signal transduction histidine kinase [Parabacteroides sp. PFB2-12]